MHSQDAKDETAETATIQPHDEWSFKHISVGFLFFFYSDVQIIPLIFPSHHPGAIFNIVVVSGSEPFSFFEKDQNGSTKKFNRRIVVLALPTSELIGKKERELRRFYLCFVCDFICASCVECHCYVSVPKECGLFLRSWYFPPASRYFLYMWFEQPFYHEN